MKEMMKKISKLLGIFGIMLVLGIVCVNNKVYAQSNSNKEFTMNEVKQMLDVYLQKNHPEIKFGTDEYNEYLVEQLSEETDRNFESDPNAELMLDYASIYLYEMEEKQPVAYRMSDSNNYETFGNRTIGELVEEIAEDEKIMESTPMPFVSISPIKTYNISNATAYAKKWAKDFNPNYKRQKSDCTNFVSQILEAGNLYGVIPQHGLPSGITSDTRYWYYLNSKQMSTSFIRVKDFYKFYSSRVLSTDTNAKSTAQKKVKKGDVVLLKRSSTGARYHAIYISKKSKGKAYYCAHTNARKDYSFNKIDDSKNNYTILKFHLYDNN